LQLSTHIIVELSTYLSINGSAAFLFIRGYIWKAFSKLERISSPSKKKNLSLSLINYFY